MFCKSFRNRFHDLSLQVEKRHLCTENIVVKICEVNDVIDREITDIRVGDEIVVLDVTVEKVRITLEENFENPGGSKRFI